MTAPKTDLTNTADLTVVGDWVTKLVAARAKQKEGKAEEAEAKEIIAEHLGDKKIGVVDGAPVLSVTVKDMSWPPALSKLDLVAEEIGSKVADAMWNLLKGLGVETTLTAKVVAPTMRTLARQVLADHTLTKEVTSINTDRFVDKKQV